MVNVFNLLRAITTSPFAICSLPRFQNARCNHDYTNRGAGQGSYLTKSQLTDKTFFSGGSAGECYSVAYTCEGSVL